MQSPNRRSPPARIPAPGGASTLLTPATAARRILATGNGRQAFDRLCTLAEVPEATDPPDRTAIGHLLDLLARFEDVSKHVSTAEKALTNVRATADGLRAALAAQVQDAHRALTDGAQSK